MTFGPRDFMEHDLPALARPRFLAIIASNTLAATMIRKSNGRADGLVVEGPTAGGHNAPPRGKWQLNTDGETIYGERDQVDLGKLRELGLPFWLAGEYGTSEKLREARAEGAAGVPVGTPFAFCVESGLALNYKQSILTSVALGTARGIYRSGGFSNALSRSFRWKVHFPTAKSIPPGPAPATSATCVRPTACPQELSANGVPAEPVNTYVAKGGKLENTVGRKCLCNALLADIGLPQARNGKRVEAALVTAGNGIAEVARFIQAGNHEYTAADVVGALSEEPAADPAVRPTCLVLAAAARGAGHSGELFSE